jgi:hypothetical protein
MFHTWMFFTFCRTGVADLRAQAAEFADETNGMFIESRKK